MTLFEKRFTSVMEGRKFPKYTCMGWLTRYPDRSWCGIFFKIQIGPWFGQLSLDYFAPKELGKNKWPKIYPEFIWANKERIKIKLRYP